MATQAALLDTVSVQLRPQSAQRVPTHHAAVTALVLLPGGEEDETTDGEVAIHSSRRRSIPATSSAPRAAHETRNSHGDAGSSAFTMVTASRDATIRCWRSTRGDVDHAHTDSEHVAVLQPASLPLRSHSRLAASSSLATSAPYSCLEGHTEWITSGVLLSDSTTLVTASLDTTVKLWNLRTGAAASSAAVAAAASPASPCIATLSKHSDYVQSLSYCASNQMLISAGLDFELYSWRVDAPGAPRLVDNLSGGGVPQATSSTGGGGEFGMHEFDRMRGSFYATSLSENGNTLLTGSSDEVVRLYDTRCLAPKTTGTPSRNWLKLLGHTDTIRSVHIQERVGTGVSMAYSASCDGTLRHWDLRMQRCLRSCLPAAPSHALKPTTIPADRMCDVRERMRLQGLGLRLPHVPVHPTAAVYSVDAPTPTSNAIWTMVLNSACTNAFTAGAGPVVWMTDLATGHSEPVVRFRSNPSQPTASSVVKLTLDEERRTLWVSSWDGSVTGWDVTRCLSGPTKPVDTTTRSRTQYLSSTRSMSTAANRNAQDSDDEEEEDHGIFPFLLSTPAHLLPLAPLPPVERCVILHDRVHALATHLNNSAALNIAPTAGAFAPVQLISTWNLVEGTCLDVARLPAADPTAPSSLNIDSIATLLNAEFARKASSHVGAPATPSAAPVPSHKLVPSWCTVDARLGCLSVNLERRQCFSADVTTWFREAITVMHTAHSAPTGPPAEAPHLGRSLHTHLSVPCSASARLNLGEVVLFNLLTEWLWIEDVAVHEQSLATHLPQDARLLRPVPPSSRWAASLLFPGRVTHGLAGSTPILSAWSAAQAASMLHQNHHRASSAASFRHNASVPNLPALPAAPPSGIVSALSVMVIPHKSNPFLPIVCSLPMTAGPVGSGPNDQARARAMYQRLMPAWIEGIVFAPGAIPAAPVERDTRCVIELETAKESEMWLQRSKQLSTQTQTVRASGGRATLTHSFTLHPPRSAISSHVQVHARTPSATLPESAAAGRSEDLSSTEEPVVTSPNATSPILSSSPPSRRQSISVLPSPRYAPQALSPVPALVNAAASASNSSASSQKIHFQLLPLPSRPRESDSTRRRLFGAGAEEDDFDAAEDEAESHRDALRMGLTSGRIAPTTVVLALPLVGSGSLVVPASLTVRRVAAYVCQRLWKESAQLIPAEMAAEFERQKLNRANASVGTPPLGAVSTVSASPASAAVASGAETKPQLMTLTPSKSTAALASHNALISPSGVNASFDSPSFLRRTTSFSVTAALHASPPLMHSPADPTHLGASSAPLAQPEHYLQLVLLNPVTGAPFLLSPDLEIGTVKEIMWAKLRRAAAGQGAAPESRRGSLNVANSPARPGRGSTTDLMSALDPAGGGASAPSTAASRTMTVYYTRSPLGEDYNQRHEPEPPRTAEVQPTPPSNLAAPTVLAPLLIVTPVQPRILAGVQTSSNLKIAVPLPLAVECLTPTPRTHASTYLPSSVDGPSSARSGPPPPVLAASSSQPVPTCTLPVSSPRRPAAAVSASRLAISRAAATVAPPNARDRPVVLPSPRGVLPSRATPNLMSESGVGVILSRHQRPSD